MNNDDGITLAVNSRKRCTHCGRVGHLAVAGPKGCYRTSQNARYRPKWYIKHLENQGRKRSSTETVHLESAAKKKRIEESDSVQGSTSD
jgi:hypothetical protein